MNDTDKDEENLPDEIDANEARVAVGKRKLFVLDIRPEEEFAEERIFGSERCDPDDVAERVAAMRDDPDDERNAVLLISTDGSDDAELAERLRDDGHQVSSLDGGFKAWADEHNPTAPGMDEEYDGPEIKIPGAVASETDEEDDDDSEASEPRPEETEDSESAERAEET